MTREEFVKALTERRELSEAIREDRVTHLPDEPDRNWTAHRTTAKYSGRLYNGPVILGRTDGSGDGIRFPRGRKSPGRHARRGSAFNPNRRVNP
ncbi:hypothetical protein LCGC14_1801740 [marine sediment metagenome]|uniref:Uncharacterized protein n=1 Tax=marine sediment metagenome TaxID=412755 RepID=A0A0F9HC63_9ZZZZ